MIATGGIADFSEKKGDGIAEALVAGDLAPEHEATGEFRSAWRVLAVSTLGVALGFPVMAFYSLGVFAPELAAEFHWSFSEIMAGMILAPVALLALGPLTGALCDRFGVRSVALISASLFGLTFMSFSLSNGDLRRYYATWLVMAVLGAGSAQSIWTRAVNQHFDARRGLALGIALSGVGFFSIFGKPLATGLIATVGWRDAYIVMGALPLLLVPAGLWGLRQYDSGGLVRASRAALVASTGLTLTQAIRSWRFWVMGIAFLLIAFANGSPVPNIENILLQHQFSKLSIASITPWLGVSIITGRAVGGWLADLIWAPLLAGILLSLTALSCVLLAQPYISYPVAVLSVSLLGIGLGVEIDLTSYMTARYLGVRHYGLLYGIFYSFIAVGAGVGPSLFGWAFDQSHSYAGVLIVAAAALIISAGLLLTLGRYPLSQQQATG